MTIIEKYKADNTALKEANTAYEADLKELAKAVKGSFAAFGIDINTQDLAELSITKVVSKALPKLAMGKMDLSALSEAKPLYDKYKHLIED